MKDLYFICNTNIFCIKIYFLNDVYFVKNLFFQKKIIIFFQLSLATNEEP